MKKPVASNPLSQIPEESGLLALHPFLFEFLTCDKWEDGTPRERGTLLVFFKGSECRGFLKDTSLSRSTWLHGRTLEEVVAAADTALMEETTVWRLEDGKRNIRR
jgi:hypothetical protein